MGRAAALADNATPEVDDPDVMAALIQVRAHREFELGTPLAAGRIIMDGVSRVVARSSEWATWLLVEAIRCAWFAGDARLAEEAAASLRALPEVNSPLVSGALGLTRLLSGDIGGGIKLMGEAVDVHALAELGVPGLTFTASLCLPLGRAILYEEITGQAVADCRKSGMIGWLTFALQDHGLAQGWLCRYGEARAALNAGLRLAADLGHEHRISHITITCSLAWVLAHQGDVEGCRANAEEGIARAETQGLVLAAAIGRWALGLLELGLGRPDAALRQLEAIPSTGIAVLSAADQVEAAIRSGRPEQAKEPLARYLAWARHVRQPSSDAIALRCRALVEEDEAHFVHAVHLHEEDTQPYEQARTQLAYGEWLRRARRRADARAQLRGALGSSIGSVRSCGPSAPVRSCVRPGTCRRHRAGPTTRSACSPLRNAKSYGWRPVAPPTATSPPSFSSARGPLATTSTRRFPSWVSPPEPNWQRSPGLHRCSTDVRSEVEAAVPRIVRVWWRAVLACAFRARAAGSDASSMQAGVILDHDHYASSARCRHDRALGSTAPLGVVRRRGTLFVSQAFLAVATMPLTATLTATSTTRGTRGTPSSTLYS